MENGCTAKPSQAGMVMAAELSVRVGLLARADAARVRALVDRAGLPGRRALRFHPSESWS
jgi:3-dehydroquinate synthetase